MATGGRSVPRRGGAQLRRVPCQRLASLRRPNEMMSTVSPDHSADRPLERPLVPALETGISPLRQARRSTGPLRQCLRVTLRPRPLAVSGEAPPFPGHRDYATCC